MSRSPFSSLWLQFIMKSMLSVSYWHGAAGWKTLCGKREQVFPPLGPVSQAGLCLLYPNLQHTPLACSCSCELLTRGWQVKVALRHRSELWVGTQKPETGAHLITANPTSASLAAPRGALTFCPCFPKQGWKTQQMCCINEFMCNFPQPQNVCTWGKKDNYKADCGIPQEEKSLSFSCGRPWGPSSLNRPAKPVPVGIWGVVLYFVLD